MINVVFVQLFHSFQERKYVVKMMSPDGVFQNLLPRRDNGTLTHTRVHIHTDLIGDTVRHFISTSTTLNLRSLVVEDSSFLYNFPK